MPIVRGREDKSRARVDHSAGGVVFQKSKHGILIGLILDPYRKWAFAKGHPEGRETLDQAARRETQEEMGIRGLKVVVPLGKIDIWFYERYRHGKRVPGKPKLIRKYIHYFLMEAPSGARTRPEKEERIRAVKWVSIKNAKKSLSYKNAQPVLDRAIAYLKKQKKPGPSQAH